MVSILTGQGHIDVAGMLCVIWLIIISSTDSIRASDSAECQGSGINKSSSKKNSVLKALVLVVGKRKKWNLNVDMNSLISSLTETKY